MATCLFLREFKQKGFTARTPLRIIALALLLICLSAIFLSCGAAKVSVTSVSVSPEKTAPGQPVTVSVNIQSLEKNPVKYPVTFKVNGLAQETRNVSVSGNETKTVTFDYTAASLGSYTVDINKQTASFQVVRPAEFVVDSINPPDQVVAGKEASLNVVVRNAGELPGTYTARLKADGKDVTSKDVQIDPGTSNVILMSYTPAVSGSHDLAVDNMTTTIKALEPAKFVGSSLGLTPNTVFTGQTVTATATISNTGQVAGTFPVTVLVNGIESGSQTLTLSPAENKPVSFKVTPKNAGSVSISILDTNATLSVVDSKSYYNDLFGYTISYPADYTVDDTVPDTLLITKTGIGGLDVLVDFESTTETAASYFDTTIQNSKKQVPDLTITSQTPIVENGVTVGYKYNFTDTVSGKKLTGEGMAIKKGGLGFVAEFSSYDTEWDKNKGLADACLASFTLPKIATGAYVNTSLGISFTLPNQWTVIETTDKNYPLLIFAPYNQPFIVGEVGFQTVPSGTVLQDYIDKLKQSFTSMGYQVTSDSAFTPTGGGTGHDFNLTESGTFDRGIVVINGTRMCMFDFIAYTSSSLTAVSADITQFEKTIAFVPTSS